MAAFNLKLMLCIYNLLKANFIFFSYSAFMLILDKLYL